MALNHLLHRQASPKKKARVLMANMRLCVDNFNFTAHSRPTDRVLQAVDCYFQSIARHIALVGWRIPLYSNTRTFIRSRRSVMYTYNTYIYKYMNCELCAPHLCIRCLNAFSHDEFWILSINFVITFGVVAMNGTERCVEHRVQVIINGGILSFDKEILFIQI